MDPQHWLMSYHIVICQELCGGVRPYYSGLPRHQRLSFVHVSIVRDFAEVFDPIIQDYHGISADAVHNSDMDVSKIKVRISLT